MRPRVIHGVTVSMALRFLEGLPSYLARHGYEVSIWSAPDAKLQEFAAREGSGYFAINLSRAITPFRDLPALVKLTWSLYLRQPDIVHAHTPKAGLFGMMAAALVGVPVRIYHIHGLPFETARGWRRRLLITCEQLAAAFATHTFAVGHGVRVTAQRTLGHRDIRVLGHGTVVGIDTETEFNPKAIAPARIAELRFALQIPETAPVIGYVGRLVRDKGIVELVAAWKKIPGDPVLVLVGPLEERDALPPELLVELRQNPRIHLVGAVEESAPYYSLCDVVVLPTFREGLPYVPLEAAAMERPVVASDIPGCVDAVTHGVTGTLVLAGDVDQLATAITRYLCDPELRRRHGRAGRKRIVEFFRPEHLHSLLEQFYRETLILKGVYHTL